MTKKELEGIIERHGKWLLGEEDGVFADLSGVDLEGLDLIGANLKRANLKRAKLRWANLSNADLSGANLKEVDLSGAKLKLAKLIGVDLSKAYLNSANLSDADLREANLKCADLGKANTKGADLRGANLECAAINKYMYQIKVGGTYDTTTTYDMVNNQVIWEHWICDDGNTLENFEKMIEDVYGYNEEPPVKKRYQEYIGAINFFKAMKKLKD